MISVTIRIHLCFCVAEFLQNAFDPIETFDLIQGVRKLHVLIPAHGISIFSIRIQNIVYSHSEQASFKRQYYSRMY